MDKEKILLLIQNFKNIQPLNLEKIPDIDLYMDQITTFIDENLSPFNRDNSQKALTKTMINNYTKDKLILPPQKKKYSKNQLISLILIYHLKSIVSINDISYILKNIEEDKFDIYSYFVNLQNEKSKTIENDFNKLIENIEAKSKDDNLNLIYLILSLLYDASCKKLLAEKLIDEFLK